ncbi:MAG TPA: SsrA-binding protein [Clostridiales bacterium]|nr:SsrA-binding protein [Clostridiales bacterium]
MATTKEHKILIQNKKARHEYFVEQTVEAGIVLSGTEVKSIRGGKANFKDSYAQVKNGELFLKGLHISKYEQGNIFNKDPDRERKLLMHKFEISRLTGLVAEKGMSLIPLSLYFKGPRVKVELGICRGKKTYDKRQDLIARDAQREIEKRMKDQRY